jgi:hypothetical protein
MRAPATLRCLCKRCQREIVHYSNEVAALHALRPTIEPEQAERIILGTGSPAGSGASRDQRSPAPRSITTRSRRVSHLDEAARRTAA